MGELQTCLAKVRDVQCCSAGLAQLGRAGAGGSEAPGAGRRVEPAEEETVCMEKETVWRKGGEGAGSSKGEKKISAVRATEGNVGVRGKHVDFLKLFKEQLIGCLLNSIELMSCLSRKK